MRRLINSDQGKTMNESRAEPSKQWSTYSSPDSSPSKSGIGHWKSFGASMDALSFGFVATAILISMFLIMAIFEHLFRPTSFSSADDDSEISLELGSMEKFESTQRVSGRYSSDLPVLMPGQQYPTFIAQPAPLPCTREGISWPSHQHDLASSP